MTSHAAKASPEIRPGSITLDERPRNSSPQSPIHIAPRPIEFTYNALQHGEIRLLTINPSQDRDAPIRATLDHGPLVPGTYQALSYAWGSEVSQVTIYLNEKPATIRENLHQVLRSVRRRTESRILWVDPLCINQEDKKEKEDQASRLSEIFRNASKVISSVDGQIKETIFAGEVVPSTWWPAFDSNWEASHLLGGDFGSEYSFDIKPSQFDCESLPGLTSTPGSPQTNSASSSPISSAELIFKVTSSVENIPLPPVDSNLWMTTMHESEVQQLLTGDEIAATATNTSQRKRSLVTAFPDAFVAPCNQKMQQTQDISSDATEKGSSVAFACPFQKFDPHKYHRCLKYTLNRIKDVKQHIYRQHTQPAYYCARCYEIFPSPDRRDEHSRRAFCKKRNSPGFEGISEDQRSELKKSSPRKKPLREQWYEVWDIIFKGHPHPQSAFIGNYVEEMIPLLRNLWNDKSSEIISGVMNRTSNIAEVDGQMLVNIMDSVFDRFEAEATRGSTSGPSVERAVSPDANSFQDIAKKDLDFSFDFEVPLDQHEFSQGLEPEFDTGCLVDFGNYYNSR